MIALSAMALACSPSAHADEEFAKQLADPIASLISAPVWSKYASGFEPTDGWRLTTNIHPVIPISLSDDRDLISPMVLLGIGQKMLLVRPASSSASAT